MYTTQEMGIQKTSRPVLLQLPILELLSPQPTRCRVTSHRAEAVVLIGVHAKLCSYPEPPVRPGALAEKMAQQGFLNTSRCTVRCITEYSSDSLSSLLGQAVVRGRGPMQISVDEKWCLLGCLIMAYPVW